LTANQDRGKTTLEDLELALQCRLLLYCNKKERERRRDSEREGKEEREEQRKRGGEGEKEEERGIGEREETTQEFRSKTYLFVQ
jgi:hypothetical protein